MTGFARLGGAENGFRWVWEMRSLNSRSLDLRLRLPRGLDRLEPILHTLVSDRITRGNVSANLSLVRPSPKRTFSVNHNNLEQIVALSKEISNGSDILPPNLDGLLSINGVLEEQEEEETKSAQQAFDEMISTSFIAVLEELVLNRKEEGNRLFVFISEHLDQIEGFLKKALALSSIQHVAFEKKLRRQIEDLVAIVPRLSEERLAQEVALLVVKGDIREEIERLSAHIEAAKDLLGSRVPIGRQFDFICQEFNREANTLCSKSGDIQLTKIGLEIKTSIDRLREQVQNIE